MLTKEATKLTNPHDLYHAYLLNEMQKDKKENFLIQKVKNDLLKSFDKNDWSLKGTERPGLTLESLRVAAILVSLQKSPEMGADVATALVNGMKSFAKNMVQNGNNYSFISQFSDEEDLNSLDLNLHMLAIFQNGKEIADLTKEQELGLRNYFLTRAVLSHNIHQMAQSLNGLKILEHIPFLSVPNGKNVVSLKDAKKKVKLDLTDMFGHPFKTIGSVNADIVPLDSNNKPTKETTVQFDFSMDQSSVVLTPKDIDIGKYKV